MNISKLKVTFACESSDYFWISFNEASDNFTITLTDGSGKPVHLANVSPKQLCGLDYQIARARKDQSQHKLSLMFGSEEVLLGSSTAK
jgi:hypothetical protein